MIYMISSTEVLQLQEYRSNVIVSSQFHDRSIIPQYSIYAVHSLGCLRKTEDLHNAEQSSTESDPYCLLHTRKNKTEMSPLFSLNIGHNTHTQTGFSAHWEQVCRRHSQIIIPLVGNKTTIDFCPLTPRSSSRVGLLTSGTDTAVRGG